MGLVCRAGSYLAVPRELLARRLLHVGVHNCLMRRIFLLLCALVSVSVFAQVPMESGGDVEYELCAEEFSEVCDEGDEQRRADPADGVEWREYRVRWGCERSDGGLDVQARVALEGEGGECG